MAEVSMEARLCTTRWCHRVYTFICVVFIFFTTFVWFGVVCSSLIKFLGFVLIWNCTTRCIWLEFLNSWFYACFQVTHSYRSELRFADINAFFIAQLLCFLVIFRYHHVALIWHTVTYHVQRMSKSQFFRDFRHLCNYLYFQLLVSLTNTYSQFLYPSVTNRFAKIWHLSIFGYFVCYEINYWQRRS